MLACMTEEALTRDGLAAGTLAWMTDQRMTGDLVPTGGRSAVEMLAQIRDPSVGGRMAQIGDRRTPGILVRTMIPLLAEWDAGHPVADLAT